MMDWQNNNQCFSERTKYIFINKLLSDCEFVIGKEKILCHKLILAMGSPVFQAMFFGYNKKSENTVDITDIEHEVFLQMIEFIYGLDITIKDSKNASDLYYAAKKYLLTFLEKKCIQYLRNNLNSSNVLFVYEFSKFHCEEELQKHCTMEIQLHTEEVLNSMKVSDMSEDILSTVLDMSSLNIPSETILIDLVEEWATKTETDTRFESLKTTTRNLLKKLRYLTLTTEEFAKGTLNSILLTEGEKLGILLRITKTVETPMNNDLCKIDKKRRSWIVKCIAELDIQDISEARCDGSEWLTSIFKTNSRLDLRGFEIRMQLYEGGTYVENLMVKVGKAYSNDHFAEGNLYNAVPYNSKAEVYFNVIATLEPNVEYAVHIFLCRPGMYPIGRHNSLRCESGSVVIEFVSHSSWEGAHPWNTTVLSSVIFSDPSTE